MASYIKEFYPIAVGNTGVGVVTPLIGNNVSLSNGVLIGSANSNASRGEASKTLQDDGVTDFSSLLIHPKHNEQLFPSGTVINKVVIKFDLKKSTLPTSSKGYLRCTYYPIAQYSITSTNNADYVYKSDAKSAIYSEYIGSPGSKDAWTSYSKDITSNVGNDLGNIINGIRMTLAIKVSDTVFNISTTLTVRKFRLQVNYTIPDYSLNITPGTGGKI